MAPVVGGEVCNLQEEDMEDPIICPKNCVYSPVRGQSTVDWCSGDAGFKAAILCSLPGA